MENLKAEKQNQGFKQARLMLRALFDIRRSSKQKNNSQQLLHLNFNNLRQIKSSAKARISGLTSSPQSTPRDQHNQINKLRSQNQRLREKLKQYQDLIQRKVQQGVRQQSQEMKAVLTDYLQFIDKILADKKILASQNQELKARLQLNNFQSFGQKQSKSLKNIITCTGNVPNRNAERQECSNCANIKSFYQSIITEIQKANHTQVQALLLALQAKTIPIESKSKM